MDWKKNIFIVLASLILGIAFTAASTASESHKCEKEDEVFCQIAGKCVKKPNTKEAAVCPPGKVYRKETEKCETIIRDSSAKEDRKKDDVLKSVALKSGEISPEEVELIETAEDDNEPRRRVRRNTEHTKAITTAITDAEAKAAFLHYSNTYKVKTEAGITSDEAEQFLTNGTDIILSRLCASPENVTYPGEGVLFETELFTMRMNKFWMKDIDMEYQNVTCGDCKTNFIQHPATINFGSQIASKYSKWNCTNSDECNGTCVATGQITQNFVTALGYTVQQRTTLGLPEIRSDVIYVKLINPKTSVHLDVMELTTPIMLNVTVTASQKELQCRWWTGSKWTTDACITTKRGATEVTCSCNRLGYISVFDSPDMTTTELPTTTSEAPTTSTAPPTTSSAPNTASTTSAAPTTTSAPNIASTTSAAPTTTSAPNTASTTSAAPTTTSAPNTASTTSAAPTTSSAPNTASTTSAAPITSSAPNTATTTSGAPNTATTTTGAPNTATTTTGAPNTATTTTGAPNTASTTTSAATTTEKTTEAPTTSPVKISVSITFNHSYTEVISNIVGFKNTIKAQLAVKYNVPESAITITSVKESSVIINFIIIHPNATAIVAQLAQDLHNGTFVLKDASGNVMSFKQGSFSSVIVTTTEPEKKKTSAVVIVVAVLCCILVIIFIVLLVIFLMKRHNKRTSPSVTPTPCPPYEESSGSNGDKKDNMNPTWTEDETNGPNNSTEKLVSEEKHYSATSTSMVGPQISASPLPSKDGNEGSNQGHGSKKA